VVELFAIIGTTCAQQPWGPKIVGVVDRRLLLGDILCSKSLIRDLKKVVVVERPPIWRWLLAQI